MVEHLHSSCPPLLVGKVTCECGESLVKLQKRCASKSVEVSLSASKNKKTLEMKLKIQQPTKTYYSTRLWIDSPD